MALTKDDIKLLASERLNDDADGGGFMTGTVIQDGVENNLFPDISELDRAQGAVDFRKFYLALMSTTVDPYYGSHVIIDKLAEDPAVSSVIHPATNSAETRSEFISKVDNSTGPSLLTGFRGTKKLLQSVAVGDRVVKADGISSRVIPGASFDTPVSGAVSNSSGPDTSTVLAKWSANIPASTTNDGLSRPRLLRFQHGVIAGSISGSVTANGVTHTIDEVPGKIYPMRLRKDGSPLTTTIQTGGSFPGYTDADLALTHDITANTVTYRPAFQVRMPKSVYSFTWTSAMLNTHVITLPYSFEVGGERVTWVNDAGENCSASCFGMDENDDLYAKTVINRVAKTITLTFKSGYKPKVSTPVTVTYVRAGYIQPLASTALGNGGVIAAGEIDITPTSGWEIEEASFKINGAYYRLSGEDVYSASGALVGSYNRALHRMLLGGSAVEGYPITEWLAVEVNQAIPITSITDATTQPNMVPETVTITGNKSAGGTFTVTADATGAFVSSFANGTYDKNTGNVSLTFTAAVDVESVTYSGSLRSYTLVSSGVAGFDPSGFNADGTVDVFAKDYVVVLHNTQELAPQTVGNGQTVNCGRTLLSDVRVFGDNGTEITTGFTVNKSAGTVTFTNVSGYSQPVKITHRVEDMALVSSLDVSGELVLSRQVSHAYPANTSYVSSAVVVGDLQARAHPGFQMLAWANVWKDTLSESGGTAILADYNEPAHPIQMVNKGAITERWAIIFTTTTSFRVVGEQVGQIAIGDTSTPCSPINPATGQPYFTIPAAGWGGGWAAGNVYRFNTEGGNAPIWVLRTINPSDPWPTQDRITVAARGSINA